jgi:hypothetical protein
VSSERNIESEGLATASGVGAVITDARRGLRSSAEGEHQAIVKSVRGRTARRGFLSCNRQAALASFLLLASSIPSAFAVTVVEVPGSLLDAYPIGIIPADTIVNVRGDTLFAIPPAPGASSVNDAIGIGPNSTIRNFGVFDSIGGFALQGSQVFRASTNITGAFNQPGTFDNLGTFIQDSGSDASGLVSTTLGDDFGVGPRFVNQGAVQIKSGALMLRGDGIHTGTFAVLSGAQLNFYSGSHSLTGGSLSVSGRLDVQFATVSVSQSTALSLPGTVFVSGSLSFASTDPISIGRLSLQGPSTPSAQVGTVHKAGDIGVTDLDAAGGKIDGAGTLKVSGTALIRGASLQLDGGRKLSIANQGTITAPSIVLSDGSSIEIQQGATLVNKGFVPSFGNATGNFIGGSGAINNAGTFVQDSLHPTTIDAGQTSISVPFNNLGTVRVDSSLLALTGGGSAAGQFITSPGGALEFRNGAFDFSPAMIVQNAGTLIYNTGVTASFKQVTTTGTIDVQSGRLELPGLRNYVSATQTLQGGRFQVSGTGTLALDTAGAGIKKISGAVDLDGPNAAIVDLGTGQNTLSALQTVAEGGGLSLANGAVLSLGHGLENSGMVVVSPGSRLSLGDQTYLQHAGQTLVAGDFATQEFHIAGGTVNGSGTIHGNTVNGGTVVVGPSPFGRLSIDGSFSQLAGGTLSVKLFGLTPGGLLPLTISGLATFEGVLDVALFGATPHGGETVQIASYGSRSGTFSELTVSGLDAGFQFQPHYDSHILYLTVVAVPEPATYLLLLAGLVMLFSGRGLTGLAIRDRRR